MATQETKTVKKSDWPSFLRAANLKAQPDGTYLNRTTKLRVAITSDLGDRYVLLITRNCNC